MLKWKDEQHKEKGKPNKYTKQLFSQGNICICLQQPDWHYGKDLQHSYSKPFQKWTNTSTFTVKTTFYRQKNSQAAPAKLLHILS